MLTLYGIKNCDTVKKARAWLEARGIEYHFHDYKTAGADRRLLEGWCRDLGWETLVNRAGTTFRKLPDATKAGVGPGNAVDLMVEHPTLIKRPVIVRDDAPPMVGFKPELYERAFPGA